MLTSVLTFGAVVTAALIAWLSAAAAAGIGVAAALVFRRTRRTTLAAPAVWAVVSSLAIATVEIAAAQKLGTADPLSISLWRYAAAASTFCPLMAVLGAKRPQDRGWQWVVLSLWVILLVPAMQAVAARSGLQLELFGAWRLLLWGLIAMGLLNYLPTRFALSAALAALGQTLLLSPYLLEEAVHDRWRLPGLLLLLAAMWMAIVVARRRPRHAAVPTASADLLQRFNDRWFAFRNAWGAFWGLRILQRINQTAELSAWPVRLEWTRGFVQISMTPTELPPEALDQQTIGHLEQTLNSLLRRFERLDQR